ncbi:unnamed protein product [Diamesa serratosioi]
MGTLRNKRQIERLESNENVVLTESNTIKVVLKQEIDFGYDHVVRPGSEDTTFLNLSATGDYIHHKQSVTLIARNANQHQFLINPIICWILLIALLLSIVISIVIVCFYFCKAKKKSSRNNIFVRDTGISSIGSHINGFSSVEMLPKYATPSQSYSSQKLYQWCQARDFKPQFKSMWSVNPEPTGVTISPSSTSITQLKENQINYKTRSLPSKNKQRPVSNIDDLDELYAKVNFSKKLRNRMTNDEAAIIAFCRSKSQNLSGAGGMPKEEATIVYDERTAL